MKDPRQDLAVGDPERWLVAVHRRKEVGKHVAERTPLSHRMPVLVRRPRLGMACLLDSAALAGSLGRTLASDLAVSYGQTLYSNSERCGLMPARTVRVSSLSGDVIPDDTGL